MSKEVKLLIAKFVIAVPLVVLFSFEYFWDKPFFQYLTLGLLILNLVGFIHSVVCGFGYLVCLTLYGDETLQKPPPDVFEECSDSDCKHKACALMKRIREG